MTTQEVVKKTGLSVSSVFRLITIGTFKAVKNGTGRGYSSRYEVDEESVNEFLKSRGIKEGYFTGRSQSLDDPVIMFSDSLKNFIEGLIPNKFKSRGEITRTIIATTDISWSSGTISNDLLYYKARKSRLDKYVEFFSKYGYSEEELVAEPKEVPTPVTTTIIETKPFDVKTLSQSELFNMLHELTPSQTLYLTMLMTNDFFYAQEAKKYKKG